MIINDFNNYLLHNYKLLLVENKLSNSSIIWYIRYINQFYKGKLWWLWEKNFPYINLDNLKEIKIQFKNEKKIANLITALRKFIILFKDNNLIYKLDKLIMILKITIIL